MLAVIQELASIIWKTDLKCDVMLAVYLEDRPQV